MIDLDWKIKGAQELNQAMQVLPRKIASKVLRQSVSAGAVFLRNEIKKVTPIRKEPGPKKAKGSELRYPGYLKRKIGARFKKKKSSYFVKHYKVGPIGYGFYGRIVEGGHVAGKKEKTFFRGSKSQGWVRGYPFIEPTFQKFTSRIIDRVGEKMGEGVIKEAKKLGIRTWGRGKILKRTF